MAHSAPAYAVCCVPFRRHTGGARVDVSIPQEVSVFHPLDPFGFGRTGYAKAARTFAPLPHDLRGLTVAVTGANGALGLATVQALAARGATVWMLVRDAARGEAARATVSGDARVAVLDVANLSAIAAFPPMQVDVLVHNAGMLADRRDDVPSPLGPLERTVATHLVGPWALSHRLQAATTIWVSSGGMYTQRLDVDATFAPPEPFDGVRAYARCKRAQLVVAAHLGHHAMHPGWADSEGVRTSLPRFHRLTRTILRTPEQGADTIVWLAATRPTTPGFWFDRAPAPAFAVPGTRHAAEEAGRLIALLEAYQAA